MKYNRRVVKGKLIEVWSELKEVVEFNYMHVLWACHVHEAPRVQCTKIYATEILPLDYLRKWLLFSSSPSGTELKTTMYRRGSICSPSFENYHLVLILIRIIRLKSNWDIKPLRKENVKMRTSLATVNVNMYVSVSAAL